MAINKKQEILWRMWLAILLPAIVGVCIVFQSFSIQQVQGKELRQLSDNLTITTRTIEPERGNIYAVDGSLLLTSLPYFEIRMDFRSEAMTDEIFNKNVDSLAIMLSKTFGSETKNKEYYKKKLIYNRQIGNRAFLLQRNIEYPLLKKMNDWPFLRLGKYKAGMVTTQVKKRIRPFDDLAKRTIGYVQYNADNSTNKVGIEGKFDEYLAGVEGKMLMQRIAGGSYIPLNDTIDVEPKQGLDVYMTIDVNFQDVAEAALKNNLIANDADYGCVVVMEVATGKIKAIANLSKNKAKGSYSENFNHAVGTNTEPGSTFKLITMAALLDDGYVKLSDIVDIEGGKKKYSDRIMKDSYKPENDTITVLECFAKSSNVGISKLVTESYGSNYTKFYNKLIDFHINNPTGIEIIGENNPTIYPPKEWSAVSLPWMSIGYEVKLSPLQTLTFYNAIANNGKMVKPYLVEYIKRYDKVIEEFEPIVVDKSIMKSSTIIDLKKMMEEVVENGTARNIKQDHLKLAGKTGTSRVANKNTSYADKVYQASFAGYFPAENPLYSCIVVVNNPKNGRYYGGSVAAPVFEEIAQKIYATGITMHPVLTQNSEDENKPILKNIKLEDAAIIYKKLGFQFEQNESATYGSISWNSDVPAIKPNFIIEDLMPDVRGMYLEDAFYVLENAGLKIKVIGSGTVKNQSIKVGETFTKGQTVELQLSL